MSLSDNDKARKRRFAERRRAAGMCNYCRNPAVPGLTRCQPCRDEVREEAITRYNAGLCKVCPSERREDRVLCEECATKAKVRNEMSKARREGI